MTAVTPGPVGFFPVYDAGPMAALAALFRLVLAGVLLWVVLRFVFGVGRPVGRPTPGGGNPWKKKEPGFGKRVRKAPPSRDRSHLTVLEGGKRKKRKKG